MSRAVADDAVGPETATRVAVHGLYAITPDLDDTGRLVALVEAALAGGARTVQYRNKTADAALRATQAARLAALCSAHRCPLIVNDHVDLALSIDGAGLHVGADDYAHLDALRRLRARLGRDRILGVSCYRDVPLAVAAVAAGADYVAFGSVFPSSTKPSAPPAALTTFGEARHLGVALVGIGGITAANLPSLIAAGADAAAVIGELFSSGDSRILSADPRIVADRARTLAAAFDDAGRNATHQNPHPPRPP